MKKFVMLMVLALPTLSMAGSEIEFDQALEIKCHQEATNAKCIDKAGEPNFSCIEKNVDKKVSSECKSLYRANSK